MVQQFLSALGSGMLSQPCDTQIYKSTRWLSLCHTGKTDMLFPSVQSYLSKSSPLQLEIINIHFGQESSQH